MQLRDEGLGVVYGASALAAAQRLDLRLIDLHERLLARRVRPLVPAPALARIWQGRSHLTLRRVLKGCTVLDLTPGLAQAAGELCAVTATDDLAAAALVITAVEHQAVAIAEGDEIDVHKPVFGDRLRIRTL